MQLRRSCVRIGCFRQNEKTKVFPKSNSHCESSDEGIQNRFGVETSRVVLDENDNWQNGKVILQNP